MLCLLSGAAAHAAMGANQFVVATDPAGSPVIQDRGETWGASWGDLNGDGYPDLWLGKHQFTPSVLLQNNGDGTFRNVIDDALPFHLETVTDDTHAAAWADFDGDGDEDLLEACGGGAGEAADSPVIYDKWRSNLYVNTGGLLVESAQDYGIDYPRARSRTPVWFDYDRDGALDVVVTALQKIPEEFSSAVFRQTLSGFVDRTVATGFDIGGCEYAMLSDLSADGQLDLLCGDGAQVRGVYDITSTPFADLRPVLGEGLFSVFPFDLAIADFNGDLLPDVFAAAQGTSTSMAIAVQGERIHASLRSEVERGFSFAASGKVQVEFGWPIARKDVFLGAGAVAPPADSDPGLVAPDKSPHHVQFTLSASNPDHLGIAAARNRGIYLGFQDGRWQVRAINVGSEVNLVLKATAVSDLQAVGSVSLDQGTPKTPMLFLNQGGRLVRADTRATFLDPASAIGSYAHSLVAGDFDNDMDVDVYVGSSGAVANVPNQLFHNQGDGTFRLVANAGGAAGRLLGRTDTVTTVDYDRDGFLDLFVTQGSYPAPFSYSGVQQLFHNQGNVNHWVELDLTGVSSNTHGIGAIVLARTPDGKVQMREQGNGMHKFAQSHRRLHFGLGGNRVVHLEVHWPSGIVDSFRNVRVDWIHEIVEGTGDQESAIGVWRPSTQSFYLDQDGSLSWTAGADVMSAPFGQAGDVPVVGDWNGDSRDEIGVWRPSTRRFYLDHDSSLSWSTGVDVISDPFGQAGDLPVVGDWNGDGRDDIGVWRPSTRIFYLDRDGSLSWSAGVDLVSAPFGHAGDLPVVGDWTGDGRDGIGVWRPRDRRFRLDTNGNGAWDNATSDTLTLAFGLSTDRPVIGDWNGDDRDDIGVWRPKDRRFLLDTSGNYRWDGAGAGDTLTLSFGFSTDIPLAGKW